MKTSSLLALLMLFSFGCGDDSSADAGTDAASDTTSAPDAAAGDASGSDATNDAVAPDSSSPDSGPSVDAGTNRFVGLCGLPATVEMTDAPPFGLTASIHYTDPVEGLIEEACAIAAGEFDGIPSVRFVNYGDGVQAQFRSDWTAESTVGGTLDSGDVTCPDGVEVSITAGSSFDDREMIFTVTVNEAESTITISSFDVTAG